MKRLILAASLIALAPSAFADDSYSAAETDNTESAQVIQPDSEAAGAGNSGEGNNEESRGEETDSSSARELDV
jgi:hypothetical protein